MIRKWNKIKKQKICEKYKKFYKIQYITYTEAKEKTNKIIQYVNVIYVIPCKMHR